MILAFSVCELDQRRRELKRDGSTVHVEPQVYDLLVHLIQNRDRVVGKDELFDTIWNGRIVSEAALSSRINAARKAIGDDGDGQKLIKTILRRGFRFVGTVRGPEPVEQEDRNGAIVEASVPAASGSAREEPPDRKPSIVVLPFANLSQEPTTDYFSYGLTEDVIRLLARNRWLEVLSRHSAAAMGGQDADPREIGALLGVRYLVQGTVTKRDDRVRITAALVSTETGRHLWGESHDITLADLLEVQRTIAEQIAAVIEPELARLEREAAVRRPPVNLGAWDCYQRGLWHLWGFTSPGLAEAEAMFRSAIELDPSFARAHGTLAYVTLQSVVLREEARHRGLHVGAIQPATLGAEPEIGELRLLADDIDRGEQSRRVDAVQRYSGLLWGGHFIGFDMGVHGCCPFRLCCRLRLAGSAAWREDKLDALGWRSLVKT